jgi:hypothetical protein
MSNVLRFPSHRVSVVEDGDRFRGECSCGFDTGPMSNSSAIGAMYHHAQVVEYEDDRRREAENLGGIL